MGLIVGNTENAVLTIRLKEHTSEDNTITLPYEGVFTVLKALKATAKRGQEWNEPLAKARILDGESLVVVDATLDETGGGLGTLDIVCSHLSAEETSGSGSDGRDDPTSTEWEIQNTEVQQPLAFHPNFPKDEPSLFAWALFLQSPATVQVKKCYLVDPENKNSQETTFPTDGRLEPWAELFNKGITTYPITLPVVTRRDTFTRRPRNLKNSLYRRDTPSGIPSELSAFVGRLESIKTGDTLTINTKTGIYTRTQQWTYAHTWDSTLYPTESTTQS